MYVPGGSISGPDAAVETMEVIKSVAGPRTRPAHRVIIACCALMWCVGMVVGFRVLGRYSTTPGVAATAPDQWPLASKLERPDGLPVP